MILQRIFFIRILFIRIKRENKVKVRHHNTGESDFYYVKEAIHLLKNSPSNSCTSRSAHEKSRWKPTKHLPRKLFPVSKLTANSLSWRYQVLYSSKGFRESFSCAGNWNCQFLKTFHSTRPTRMTKKPEKYTTIDTST